MPVVGAATPQPVSLHEHPSHFGEIGMERQLRDDKLLETAEGVQRRILMTFPGSGLSEVAGEVVNLLRQSLVVAERIRRPNLWLRAGLILLPLLLVLVFWFTFRTEVGGHIWDRVFKAVTANQVAVAWVIAVFVFLITLEVRLKRHRTIKAVHELRAMAHLIDMHQLAKDPGLLACEEASEKTLTPETMGRYLHYCTELLALVSKIGHMYVQGFADVGAMTAVDHCESLSSGLSQKIWQKIMILDRIRADAADDTVATVQPKPR
jgi:hypothetical protein